MCFNNCEQISCNSLLIRIPVKVKYYTSASNRTEVNVTKVLDTAGIVCCGTVQVVSSVYGYVKCWLGSGVPFEKGECSLPPLQYETTACWVDVPLGVKKALEAAGWNLQASIHAEPSVRPVRRLRLRDRARRVCLSAAAPLSTYGIRCPYGWPGGLQRAL